MLFLKPLVVIYLVFYCEMHDNCHYVAYNAAIRTAEYIVCYEGHSRKIIPRNNIHTLHAKSMLSSFFTNNILHIAAENFNKHTGLSYP